MNETLIEMPRSAAKRNRFQMRAILQRTATPYIKDDEKPSLSAFFSDHVNHPVAESIAMRPAFLGQLTDGQ